MMRFGLVSVLLLLHASSHALIFHANACCQTSRHLTAALGEREATKYPSSLMEGRVSLLHSFYFE
jgi:hypothetical protein